MRAEWKIRVNRQNSEPRLYQCAQELRRCCDISAADNQQRSRALTIIRALRLNKDGFRLYPVAALVLGVELSRGVFMSVVFFGSLDDFR